MEKEKEKEKEKQSKLRSKIFKILPKAAAAISVTFQNTPFSPGRVKPHGSTSSSSKRFSGPLVPKEAQDPTSPTISCMGQIKHKKMQMIKSRSLSVAVSSHMRSDKDKDKDSGSSSSTPRDRDKEVKINRQGSSSMFQRMLMFKPPKPAKSVEKNSEPPLGEMRRFASGRESFASFDWKAQIAPDEIENIEIVRDCYTDEKRRQTSVHDHAFSGPILGGFQSMQPRKEINLWKRRTTAQPRPLQLKPVLTAK